MSQINPFTGSIIQSTAAQQRQVVEKNQKLRRLANLSKNSALQGDRLEHQVESPEAPAAAHDQESGNKPREEKNSRPDKDKEKAEDEKQPRIDLTA